MVSCHSDAPFAWHMPTVSVSSSHAAVQMNVAGAFGDRPLNVDSSTVTSVPCHSSLGLHCCSFFVFSPDILLFNVPVVSCKHSVAESPMWAPRLCLSCPPALHNIFHTPVARYSLFVLKVPLNTNQLSN